MLDISYLIQALDKTILEQRIGCRDLKADQGIILLKNQSELLEHYLYVGGYLDGIRLLSCLNPKRPVTLFLSADDVNHVKLPEGSVHNLIVSTLDIFDLYNRINLVISNYHRWTRSLMEALCSGQTLSQILNLAADMIKSQIFILNPGFKMIAGSSALFFDEPLSKELSMTGYLSFESSLKLFTGFKQLEHDGEYKHLSQDNAGYHIYEIRHGSYTLATVMLVCDSRTDGIDFKHLLIDLSDIIRGFLLKEQEVLISQNALCASFIQDVVEEKISESAEIRNRIRFLPNPLKAFCCMVIIRFGGGSEIPYSYVIQQLEELFPDTNMAVYQNDIVILHSQEERPDQKMDFDYEKLNALLERYQAYAGISNASRHRIRLRTLYLLAAASIRLGKALHKNPVYDRIFSYEDCSMYYIADLCAAQYMEVHHHNDLIYLIHPKIIKICRYDAQHKTNLRDVLFYYLLCGCSLNRTAQIMYMHRNTVLNKLNKINEIAEIPLDDGYTQQRMVMSCLIMRYYEDYMHMTLRL